MELFTPAWNSKYPEKRMNAVRKITDMEKLQRITEKTKYEDVRQEAWKRIARGAEARYTREAAIEKITDQAVLKEAVLKDSVISIRKLAVAKITDQGVLKEIALQASHSDIVQAAVKKITDQSFFRETALKDLDWGLCEAAWGMIIDPDQAFLKKAALGASSGYVRNVAVAKIIDQILLKKVAREDSNKHIRETAVAKITDQAFLAEVASKDSDSSVRYTAIKKITDQVFLKEAALAASSDYLGETAVEKITDQALLKEIALKSPHWRVCKAAIEKITKQFFLKEIALKAPIRDASREAWKKITDPDLALVKEVALNGLGSEGEALNAAVKQMTDPKYLNEIFLYIKEGFDKKPTSSGAHEIILFARKAPELVKPYWRELSAKISAPHSDHGDYPYGYYDDNGTGRVHTDNGNIGMSFPPYPFTD